MPTVIDSLVVELGLDPAKFTQGQKDALDSFKRTQEGATKVGKDIEAQGTKVDHYFSTLKRNALGLVAGFAAGYGIKEFTAYVTNLDATTGRLAKTMNMSVKDLAAWQGAFEQNGGSAASAASALQGLSGEMNKFMLTGQTSMLPILNSMGIGLFDANKNLKTSGRLLLDIADAIKGMDTARASAALSLIPGMNQDTVNLLVQGRAAVEGYLNAAKMAGGTTDESAASAKKYQENLSLLDRSATSLGRSLTTILAPGLTAVFNTLSRLLQGWNAAVGSPEAKKIERDSNASTRGILGSPRAFVAKVFGEDTATKLYGTKEEEQAAFDQQQRDLAKASVRPAEEAQKTTVTRVPGSGTPSASEQETYIRQSAIARGINPDVAVAVAKSEGLNGYVGDKGTSFGPFQLHYKNNIPGLSNGGLGDVFTKQTGKHASDPSTWKEQVDFALDEARKSGWGAWHGWKGLPNAGIGAAPAGAAGAAAGGRSSSSSNSTSITVGKIELHSSKASPAEVAAEIPDALRRANFAASANYAQTG